MNGLPSQSLVAFFDGPMISRLPVVGTAQNCVSSPGRVADERGTGTGGHAQGRVRADVGRQARAVGGQRAALRRLGDLPRQGLAGRPEPALRLAVQRLVRPADPALRRRRRDAGSRSATTSATTAMPGTHQWYDGTPHPWEFARVWHLEPSLDRPRHRLRRRGGRRAVPLRPTAGSTGRSCPGCAATGPGRRGSRARAACACTRSSSTRPTPGRIFVGHLRRGRVPLPTTAARPGSRSTAACTPRASRTRTPRSATACTASPCTRRARPCCSCRSTGT